MKLARLKNVNKRTGNLAKTYDFGGQIFRLGRWYKVDAATADRLAMLTVDPYDETSMPVFDVFTPSDALKIERKEKKAELKRRGIHIPKEEAEAPDTESLVNVKDEPETIKASEVDSLADMVDDADTLDDDAGDGEGDEGDGDAGEAEDLGESLEPDDDDDESGDMTTEDLPKPKAKKPKKAAKKKAKAKRKK